ncbi:MAG: hypothetical protein KAX23_04840 [Dehalococcoidia bacterium]|nr:hypothetical protein [Chloroflexota bacterium]MCK4242856.1 hypothetical protein [Dehalococcoidia bacterium]
MFEILLCDEDIGTRIPRALTLVGCEARSLRELGWGGWLDVKWLALAGEKQWLVFSCNKKILKVPDEREAIIRGKVGIVFLTSGEENIARVLKLLLAKWEILELLWDTTERPFARFLSLHGRLTDKFKDYQL